MAAIEATEIQRKQAQDALEDSDVKAPISGIIAFKNVEVGALVSPQAPAYTIVDMDNVVVETTVTERVINSIAKGQDVIVKIDALGGKTFKGTVDALSPSATGNSVGYPLKVTIPNENHEIKPGMFAEISIVIEQKDDVLLVPIETVLTEDGKNYVYVLEGDIAKKREITTGLKDEKNYEIVNGLKEGERVILKGQSFIVDGEKVQVVGGNN